MTWGGRGWWDWEVVPGPPEVLNQGFHGTGGALRVTKHWNSLSSREEVAEDGNEPSRAPTLKETN